MNLERLREAVALEGGIATVAKKSGVSRTALSLIINGKYGANPHKILQKVENAYNGLKDGMVLCPALKDEMSAAVCKKYRNAVKNGVALGGVAFSTVKTICPFCAHY